MARGGGSADVADGARPSLRFGWILFLIPFLIVYFPGLLLIGTAQAIISDIATVLASGAALWLAARAGSAAVRAARRHTLSKP